MSRPTQDPAKSLRNFAYGALTLSGLSFQIILLSLQVLYRSPTTPTGKPAGLGSFLFARRYLGNRFFFLFLQLLRCFSSLRLPSLTLTVNDNTSRYWVPPFGYLRIIAYLLLPEAFRVRHVLHRLLVPRHSPCALFYLTYFKLSFSLFSVALQSVFSIVSVFCF